MINLRQLRQVRQRHRATLSVLRCIITCALLLVFGLCLEVRAAPPATKKACTAASEIIIAFVGDIILQDELQRIALADGSSYRRFWSSLDSIFQAVDGVYGNLEGTIARNITYSGKLVTDPGRDLTSEVYSKPTNVLNFNYHHSLARDLRASGFRVISTGNNHALDRGPLGADQTIEQLEQEGITPIGTKHSKRLPMPWARVVRMSSMNIGWVGCTYGTNGHPDIHDQVLDCYREKLQVLEAVRTLARNKEVAAIFFVPHWGIENHTVIERRQQTLAREAIDAGATAVIGTHPHVLQEWHWYTSLDGRRAPIVYSTGNFVSAQPLERQRDGLILLVTLRRTGETAKARLASVRYLLTHLEQPSWRMSIIDYDPARHSMLPLAAHLGAAAIKAPLTSCIN